MPPSSSSTPPSALRSVRLLLVQARNTADMERQEQECFLERCHLQSDQITSVNVVREPLRDELLDEVDALMIGGAGEYSAMDNPAWMPSLLRLVRVATDRALPTFGSCWGHQVIARALGGEVIHDSERAELGCGTVQLTRAGTQDELFSRFPHHFKANMGHHDRVTVLPPDAIELAFNESQRNQAFRIADKPVYGTQFHSELSAQRERERLIAYRDYYRKDVPDEDEFERILDGLAATTEVDHLLYDFLLTFVVPGAETTPHVAGSADTVG